MTGFLAAASHDALTGLCRVAGSAWIARALPRRGGPKSWSPQPHAEEAGYSYDTISFELAPTTEGGTTFVLTEELNASHAARNAAGWDACLDLLEMGVERQSWQNRFDGFRAEFEPMLGRQKVHRRG